MGPLVIICLLLILGLVPAGIAHSRGRSFVIWWLYGIVLPPFALVHALGIPRVRTVRDRQLLAEGMKACPHCAELIRAGACLCRYCGRETATSVAAEQRRNR